MRKYFVMGFLLMGLASSGAMAEASAWGKTKAGTKEAWSGVKQGSKKAWGGVKKGSKEAWQETRGARQEVKKGSKSLWQSIKGIFD